MSKGESGEARTGLFHQKSSNDYVVIWRGRVICRYPSLDAFVTAHEAGIKAMDANQAELLNSFYRDH